jgi:hypothetical protein
MNYLKESPKGVSSETFVLRGLTTMRWFRLINERNNADEGLTE